MMEPLAGIELVEIRHEDVDRLPPPPKKTGGSHAASPCLGEISSVPNVPCPDGELKLFVKNRAALLRIGARGHSSRSD
jgi:hypothetical protein